MKLPAPPRTMEEVNFFVDESPCEVCGQRGLMDEQPRYKDGVYLAMCATCKNDRTFLFPPLYSEESAPAWFLSGDAEPTALFDAAQLRAIVDREMERVPREPTEIATMTAYKPARRHLVKSRIALHELAKFHPGNPAIAGEVAAASALWEAYVQAKDVIESKPGALPPARGLGDRFSQHAHWLRRGKAGDGQLVFRNEVWRHSGMGAARMHWAQFEDTSFHGIDFSFTQFDHAIMRRTHFLGCDLNMAQLDEATLDGCDLKGSALGLATLRGTKVSGGDWQGIAAGRSRWSAHAVAVDLREARFRDAVLDGTVFERCDLRGADFSRKDAHLESLGTTRGARFVECDLRGANVEGWRIAGAVFERCRMHGLIGSPELGEGDAKVIAADLSPDGDRSVVGVSWPR